MKDYILPSGKLIKIQGYENYTLGILLKEENINENDIFVNKIDVPEIWYTDTEGKKRRYYVDCYIKSQNRCIETKSTYTYEKGGENVKLKQQAVKKAGFDCEIWIFNSKGKIEQKL